MSSATGPALCPGGALKELIAETLGKDSRNQVLFTRLLTDNQGRLLNITELGRYPSTRLAEAIKIRAGTCRFPTCTVPADRCDLDHHEPVPKGYTSGKNMDPFCRRHHRGKTSCTMTGRPLRRLQELAPDLSETCARTFASDEGGESGGRPVRVRFDFAWHAAFRDDHGVDWTMPDAEHYRCIDEPLPTGRAA